MSQKTLIESITSLIGKGLEEGLKEEFTSTDILDLKDTEPLKDYKNSSLQTYCANASLSHPDAGDLGIGIPVSRGLQTPYFWRVRKEGRSLVYKLISKDEGDLVEKAMAKHEENAKSQGAGYTSSADRELLTVEQEQVVRAAALVLGKDTKVFVKMAIDNLLEANGLKPLPERIDEEKQPEAT